MDDFEAQLISLEQELRKSSSAPPGDLPAFLDDWLRRLRSVPFGVTPKRRVSLLIDAASQYYLHGQKIFNAVEPIALAVMLAEQSGDMAQLRRALSIQGAILTATRNIPDALRSLLWALDVAEGLNDQFASANVWVNIAVTFFEATLYNDARVCFHRAERLASTISDEERVGKLRSRALHGVSMCALYLHEYLQGAEACTEALALLSEPRDREQQQLRALIESTNVQLLLALNQIDEAGVHAALAREMAARSGAARAKIAAATVSGLVDVHKGNVDVGISRIVAIREQSKILPGPYQEALLASVNAYEKPDSLTARSQ
jgi:tetratricopeptide (TPR) repeat protein